MQALKGTQLIETKVASGEWRRKLEAQPQLALIQNRAEHYIDLPSTLKTFTTWLGNSAGAIVKGSVSQVLGLCLVLNVLFFFLRNRHLVLKSIMFLSPLSQAEMGRLFKRVGDTIHATVYGTFGSLIAQGLTGIDAAKLGVYVHGFAADALVKKSIGPVGKTASEVALEARNIINQLNKNSH